MRSLKLYTCIGIALLCLVKIADSKNVTTKDNIEQKNVGTALSVNNSIRENIQEVKSSKNPEDQEKTEQLNYPRALDLNIPTSATGSNTSNGKKIAKKKAGGKKRILDWPNNAKKDHDKVEDEPKKHTSKVSRSKKRTLTRETSKLSKETVVTTAKKHSKEEEKSNEHQDKKSHRSETKKDKHRKIEKQEQVPSKKTTIEKKQPITAKKVLPKKESEALTPSVQDSKSEQTPPINEKTSAENKKSIIVKKEERKEETGVEEQPITAKKILPKKESEALTPSVQDSKSEQTAPINEKTSAEIKKSTTAKKEETKEETAVEEQPITSKKILTKKESEALTTSVQDSKSEQTALSNKKTSAEIKESAPTKNEEKEKFREIVEEAAIPLQNPMKKTAKSKTVETEQASTSSERKAESVKTVEEISGDLPNTDLETGDHIDATLHTIEVLLASLKYQTSKTKTKSFLKYWFKHLLSELKTKASLPAMPLLELLNSTANDIQTDPELSEEDSTGVSGHPKMTTFKALVDAIRAQSKDAKRRSVLQDEISEISKEDVVKKEDGYQQLPDRRRVKVIKKIIRIPDSEDVDNERDDVEAEEKSRYHHLPDRSSVRVTKKIIRKPAKKYGAGDDVHGEDESWKKRNLDSDDLRNDEKFIRKLYTRKQKRPVANDLDYSEYAEEDQGSSMKADASHQKRARLASHSIEPKKKFQLEETVMDYDYSDPDYSKKLKKRGRQEDHDSNQPIKPKKKYSLKQRQIEYDYDDPDYGRSSRTIRRKVDKTPNKIPSDFSETAIKPTEKTNPIPTKLSKKYNNEIGFETNSTKPNDKSSLEPTKFDNDDKEESSLKLDSIKPSKESQLEETVIDYDYSDYGYRSKLRKRAKQVSDWKQQNIKPRKRSSSKQRQIEYDYDDSDYRRLSNEQRKMAEIPKRSSLDSSEPTVKDIVKPKKDTNSIPKKLVNEKMDLSPEDSTKVREKSSLVEKEINYDYSDPDYKSKLRSDSRQEEDKSRADYIKPRKKYSLKQRQIDYDYSDPDYKKYLITKRRKKVKTPKQDASDSESNVKINDKSIEDTKSTPDIKYDDLKKESGETKKKSLVHQKQIDYDYSDPDFKRKLESDSEKEDNWSQDYIKPRKKSSIKQRQIDYDYSDPDYKKYLITKRRKEVKTPKQDALDSETNVKKDKPVENAKSTSDEKYEDLKKEAGETRKKSLVRQKQIDYDYSDPDYRKSQSRKVLRKPKIISSLDSFEARPKINSKPFGKTYDEESNMRPDSIEQRTKSSRDQNEISYDYSDPDFVTYLRTKARRISKKKDLDFIDEKNLQDSIEPKSKSSLKNQKYYSSRDFGINEDKPNRLVDIQRKQSHFSESPGRIFEDKLDTGADSMQPKRKSTYDLGIKPKRGDNDDQKRDSSDESDEKSKAILERQETSSKDIKHEQIKPDSIEQSESSTFRKPKNIKEDTLDETTVVNQQTKKETDIKLLSSKTAPKTPSKPDIVKISPISNAPINKQNITKPSNQTTSLLLNLLSLKPGNRSIQLAQLIPVLDTVSQLVENTRGNDSTLKTLSDTMKNITKNFAEKKQEAPGLKQSDIASKTDPITPAIRVLTLLVADINSNAKGAEITALPLVKLASELLDDDAEKYPDRASSIKNARLVLDLLAGKLKKRMLSGNVLTSSIEKALNILGKNLLQTQQPNILHNQRNKSDEATEKMMEDKNCDKQKKDKTEEAKQIQIIMKLLSPNTNFTLYTTTKPHINLTSTTPQPEITTTQKPISFAQNATQIPLCLNSSININDNLKPSKFKPLGKLEKLLYSTLDLLVSPEFSIKKSDYGLKVLPILTCVKKKLKNVMAEFIKASSDCHLDPRELLKTYYETGNI